MGFWKDLMNSKFEIWWEDSRPREVHNNYYLTINNKVVQVTEEQFKKYVQENKIVSLPRHEVRLLK